MSKVEWFPDAPEYRKVNEWAQAMDDAYLTHITVHGCMGYGCVAAEENRKHYYEYLAPMRDSYLRQQIVKKQMEMEIHNREIVMNPDGGKDK